MSLLLKEKELLQRNHFHLYRQALSAATEPLLY
jgi:hypothetical protein